MPFVPSTGTLSFNNDIEAVFEDQSPPTMSLSEYYRNGTNVQTAVTAGNVDTNTVVTSGIPTSGTISFSDFRNQGYDLLVQSAIYDRNNTNITLGTEFTFTVPSGVTEISAFCVGAGGGGGGNDGVSGPTSSGGGGGGAVWGHWTVSPGSVFYCNVGVGGYGGSTSPGISNGGNGGDTYIRQGTTYFLRAYGGDGGITNYGSNNVISYTGGSGGSYTGTQQGGGGVGGDGGDGVSNSGGGGGGGAGGYGGAGSGTGGDGQAGFATSTTQTDGVGGAGAGGEQSNSGYVRVVSSGGAVGIFGQGNSGSTTGSTDPRVSSSRHGSTYSAGFPGNVLVPASGLGSITVATGRSITNNSGKAASPGAGGGGLEDDTLGLGQEGGDGAIRIVWGYQSDGTTQRRYPSAFAVAGDY